MLFCNSGPIDTVKFEPTKLRTRTGNHKALTNTARYRLNEWEHTGDV